jgi:hypothetical protein
MIYRLSQRNINIVRCRSWFLEKIDLASNYLSWSWVQAAWFHKSVHKTLKISYFETSVRWIWGCFLFIGKKTSLTSGAYCALDFGGWSPARLLHAGLNSGLMCNYCALIYHIYLLGVQKPLKLENFQKERFSTYMASVLQQKTTLSSAYHRHIIKNYKHGMCLWVWFSEFKIHTKFKRRRRIFFPFLSYDFSSTNIPVNMFPTCCVSVTLFADDPYDCTPNRTINPQTSQLNGFCWSHWLFEFSCLFFLEKRPSRNYFE